MKVKPSTVQQFRTTYRVLQHGINVTPPDHKTPAVRSERPGKGGGSNGNSGGNRWDFYVSAALTAAALGSQVLPPALERIVKASGVQHVALDPEQITALRGSGLVVNSDVCVSEDERFIGGQTNIEQVKDNAGNCYYVKGLSAEELTNEIVFSYLMAPLSDVGFDTAAKIFIDYDGGLQLASPCGRDFSATSLRNTGRNVLEELKDIGFEAFFAHTLCGNVDGLLPNVAKRPDGSTYAIDFSLAYGTGSQAFSLHEIQSVLNSRESDAQKAEKIAHMVVMELNPNMEQYAYNHYGAGPEELSTRSIPIGLLLVRSRKDLIINSFQDAITTGKMQASIDRFKRSLMPDTDGRLERSLAELEELDKLSGGSLKLVETFKQEHALMLKSAKPPAKHKPGR